MRYSLIVTALVAAALLGFSPGPAQAILAGEALDDPVLEARARDIGKGLRCLVRERLEAGESDQQVMDYIVARYGDYVLLKPPFKPITYALWLGPGLMLLVAGAGVVVFLRRQSRRAPTAEAPLDDDERRRLASMLDDA